MPAISRHSRLCWRLLGLAVAALVVMFVTACGGPTRVRFPDDPTAAGPPRAAWCFGRPLYEVHPRGYSASGDLAGITRDLDRLAALGVRTLVVAPIFPTGPDSNLYAVRDHGAVDPALGGHAALVDLIRAAHRRGIGVLLDVVLPLAATDHVQIADHPQWFRRDGDGRLTTRLVRWSGVVDLELDDPEVRDYLAGSLARWLDDGVDGFRFAFPTLAPDDFWRDLLARTREHRPEAVLIAEGAAPALRALGFDAYYAVTLKAAFDEARADDYAEPFELENIWAAAVGVDSSLGAGRTAITFLEDHFSRRTVRDYGWPAIRPYAAFLFTIPGTPQLLMGQEQGTSTHVEARRAYTLVDEAADPRHLALYGDLARLRAGSETLCRGDLARVPIVHKDAVMYTRTLGDEIILCAVNFSDGLPVFPIPAGLRGRCWQDRDGDDFAAGGGAALPDTVVLGPHEVRIWRGFGEPHEDHTVR